MAGKRQHYIMRLLLNGFASRTQGDQTYVWCFRNNTPPFETNTSNIGVEGDFYGKSGKGSLDEFITEDVENTHRDCIHRVRQNPTVISSADKQTLIDFVHSLVLRPKHLRETMEKGVRAVLEQALPIFTDTDAARQFLLNESKANTPVWDNFLTEYVRKKYGKQTSQREKLLKWKSKPELKRWLYSPEAKEKLEQLTAAAKIQFPPLFEELVPGAKTSHNSALRKGLQTDTEERSPRYLYYLQLHWRVQTFDSGSLILGDIPVLQFERKAKKFSVAWDGIDGDMVFLPLSHNLLIIGSCEAGASIPSPQEINRHSAALSIDYFVASRNSEQERNYQEILGIHALQFPKVFGQGESV
jgi:hypothetical protein